MNEQALFDTCWQALKSGESLDAIFERYPDQRQELEPMLAAAGQLQSVSTVAAPPAFRQQARARLLEQISVAPQETAVPYSQRLALWWRDLLAAGARPFAKPVWAGAAMGLLLAVFLLTSTTYAAQGAIPGDSLYSFKMVSEQVWLQLAADASDLDLTLAERRLAEARMLQTRNRHDAIPEALARYQQTLENWSEQTRSARLQDQGRVQQRLREQLRTLQQMGEDAPIRQQVMLQDQHRETERLMRRFGPPVTPTPQHQPVNTPDPARMQQTPAGPDGTPGHGQPTPGGQHETPEQQATPVPPTRKPTRTPTATVTGDVIERTPPGPGNGEKPEPSPPPQNTPAPPTPGTGPHHTATPPHGSGPNHTTTPDHGSGPSHTATPNHGSDSPTHTPASTPTPSPPQSATPPQGSESPTHTPNPPADTPTPAPSPTAENSPTTSPGATVTPGSGSGSPPTATPGHGGSGGTPPATKTPGHGGG